MTLLSLPMAVVLLAALPGLLLLMLWWHGRLALDDPYCGSCGHSLRGSTAMPTRCGECGKEFRRIGSVKFARRVRRARVAIIGAMLLLLGPALAFGTQRWQATRTAAAKAAQQAAAQRAILGQGGSMSASTAPNKAIVDDITERDPRNIQQWSEAASRVQRGTFTDEEIEALIAAFERWAVPTADGQRAGGMRLNELRQFAGELGGALAGSPQVTPQQRQRLAASWFDPIDGSGALRTSTGGRGRLAWGPTDGVPWQSSGPGPGMIRVQRLREMRIDGSQVEPTKDEKRQWLLLPMLSPGDHAIELDFEWVVSTTPSEERDAFLKDGGSSPLRSKAVSATGSFAAMFEDLDNLPEPEGKSPRRLAAGTETLTRTLIVRGPDEALLDPLDDAATEQQRRVLAKAKVDQAVLRPVGGPGQQTLHVRVVHAASGSANMIGRLVVKAGDREIVSPPRTLFLRARGVPQGQQLEPIVLFELDELIDALPRDVGKIEVFIEPVKTIPGLAIDINKGIGERVDLGTVTLRRADLGE